MKLAWTVLAVAVACGGGAAPRTSTLPVYLEVTAVTGETIRLRELRGRPVVLHLFTVGAMAAQMDVAQLNAAHDAGRATVLGISLDPPGAEVLVRAWPDGAGARYPIAFGSQELITGKTDLGPVPVAPTTIVLDAEGREVFRAARQLRPGELDRALREQ